MTKHKHPLMLQSFSEYLSVMIFYQSNVKSLATVCCFPKFVVLKHYIGNQTLVLLLPLIYLTWKH